MKMIQSKRKKKDPFIFHQIQGKRVSRKIISTKYSFINQSNREMPPLCINHLMQSIRKKSNKLKAVYETLHNLPLVVEPIVDKSDHNSNLSDSSYKYYNIWMTLPANTNAVVLVEEEYEDVDFLSLSELVDIFKNSKQKIQSKDDMVTELNKLKAVEEQIESSERSPEEKRRLVNQLSDLEDDLIQRMKNLTSHVRHYVLNPQRNGKTGRDTNRVENSHQGDRVETHSDDTSDVFISSYYERLEI